MQIHEKLNCTTLSAKQYWFCKQSGYKWSKLKNDALDKTVHIVL